MRKIELLAPAGDLERLKYAIRYGADAVYIGGKHFSLRSMASNFTLEDIKEGCAFAHAHNSKIYVTCNIVMHETDLVGLDEYLLDLEKCGVDGIIASSPLILSKVKSLTKMEAHVSTQQSVSNSKGIKFFSSLDVDRVVLARECSLENIKEICKNTDVDVEVFIEGAMCASVSGRCMLSNIMTNRDANRGGCAQSCRWNYDIYKNDEKVSFSNYEFSLGSADLNGVEFIPELIEAGVSSLKIEGRMKTLHYVATVVNTYRRAIDEYYKDKKIDINAYKKELKKAENRKISHGFFKGELTPNEEIYNEGSLTASHDFLGIITSYNMVKKEATLEVRNYFESNREVEVLSPHQKPFSVFIKDIYDELGEKVEFANHPKSKIIFKSEVPLHEFDLISNKY